MTTTTRRPFADFRLPRLGTTLRRDVQRTYELAQGGRVRRVAECLRAPGVQAVVVFRFGQWLQMQPTLLRVCLEPAYVVANALIQILWGIELPRSTSIGPGLYIGHFGGITISRHASIGSRCTISQSVTIGVAGQGEKAGAPTIGDDVYIGPGARLFGKITIGSNAKIGANAVIHRSVPANAIAVLDPGFKIISDKGNRPALGAAPVLKRAGRAMLSRAQRDDRQKQPQSSAQIYSLRRGKRQRSYSVAR